MHEITEATREQKIVLVQPSSDSGSASIIITLYPRSYAADEEDRRGAGDLISRTFGLTGLLTGLQMFKPTQFHAKFYSAGGGGGGDPDQLPTGSNIMGILPGRRWGTPRDKVGLYHV